MKEDADGGMWRRMVLMSVLSFLAMYWLMYMMVDSVGNVYANVNQLYMAAAMTAAMVAIEVVVMAPMYGPKRRVALVAGAAVAAVVLFFALTRAQAAVSDEEFLRSMIPHHGGAILMCQEADLHDPDIRALCDRIVDGQRGEIELMRRMLEH